MTRFPGERMVAGTCPLLVDVRDGRDDRAPVVFLPGALHTARIGYGLPHDRAEDFLAHWITNAGHPFIGVSYPLATGEPVFDSVDPALRIDQLADAIAGEVGSIITEAGWQQTVIVAAWSALGNIAPRLWAAMGARDLDLGTFVALAATPPLPNLILGSPEASEATVGDDVHYTDEGLLWQGALRSETFFAELDRIDSELERCVIDRDDYRNHHLGDMALELFPGLEVTRAGDHVVVDHGSTLTLSNGARWASYPICASIEPTFQSDRRHVLTDRHNWAMVNANVAHWRLLADVGDLSDATWHRVVEIVHRFGSELHRSVAGGHFFFVGEPGARVTARAILDLDEQRRGLDAELAVALAG